MALRTKTYNSLQVLNGWGGLSFLAGIVIAACFVMLASLPSLRGRYVIPFLAYFTLASFAYMLAVGRLTRDPTPLVVIWGFAIFFRILLLFSDPSLSDDVYRYIWDGHLLNQGLNPYTYPVNHASLDNYSIPARLLVNHDWMASPYLPIAQLYFGLVYFASSGSQLAFQIGAVILDLGIGFIVLKLMIELGLPPGGALIYLWSPLVVVEFTNGTHADALMIFLIILAFWFIVRMRVSLNNRGIWRYASAMALAAATLTKGIPAILALLFLRRWGWRGLLTYMLAVFLPLLFFALDAGWGLVGPFDGSGVFGALRIYLRQWNFNSGLYHWLEVHLTGIRTQGAVPLGADTVGAINLAKGISGVLMGAALIGITLWAWRWDNSEQPPQGGAGLKYKSLGLLRLALLVLSVYILLTTTVHPWYVTILIAFLPFLLPVENESLPFNRFIWPWLYFSWGVGLSYLTYIDPSNLREYALVRRLEYFPLYLLFVWAAWPFLRLAVSSLSRHWKSSAEY